MLLLGAILVTAGAMLLLGVALGFTAALGDEQAARMRSRRD